MAVETSIWGENSNSDFTGVTEDTFIWSKRPSINYGREYDINVDGDTEQEATEKILIKFDFSNIGNLCLSA